EDSLFGIFDDFWRSLLKETFCPCIFGLSRGIVLVVDMELERKVHYALHFCSDKQKRRNFFTPLKFEKGWWVRVQMDRRWGSDGETALDDLTSNKIKIFIECLSISYGNPN